MCASATAASWQVFAKGKDLAYFVKQICGIPYEHIEDFAPTKDVLDRWHKQEVTWPEYEQIYMTMLKEREILRKHGIRAFNCVAKKRPNNVIGDCWRNICKSIVQRKFALFT